MLTKTGYLQLKIEPRTKLGAARLAAERGITLSELVRRLLAAELAEAEAVVEAEDDPDDPRLTAAEVLAALRRLGIGSDPSRPFSEGRQGRQGRQ